MKLLSNKKGQVGEILVVVILLVLAVVGVVKFILPMFNSTTTQMDDVSGSLTNLSGDAVYGASDGTVMQGAGVISDINSILTANVTSGNQFTIKVTKADGSDAFSGALKAGKDSSGNVKTTLGVSDEDKIYKNGKYIKTYQYAGSGASTSVLESITYTLQ